MKDRRKDPDKRDLCSSCTETCPVPRRGSHREGLHECTLCTCKEYRRPARKSEKKKKPARKGPKPAAKKAVRSHK